MMKKLLMLGTSKGSCEMIRIAKARVGWNHGFMQL